MCTHIHTGWYYFGFILIVIKICGFFIPAKCLQPHKLIPAHNSEMWYRVSLEAKGRRMVEEVFPSMQGLLDSRLKSTTQHLSVSGRIKGKQNTPDASGEESHVTARYRQKENWFSPCSLCCTFWIMHHRLVLPAVVQFGGKYHLALKFASLDSSRHAKRDVAFKEEMTFLQ